MDRLPTSPPLPAITRFFVDAVGLVPAFENDMFSEFVLASRFRIAFFKPVGLSAQSFEEGASRKGSAVGLTVTDVDVFARLDSLRGTFTHQLNGPPKERAPAGDGLLVNRP